MFKKVLVLFILIVFYISGYALCANVVLGIWEKPQYIKTYIQPNHPRTVMMKHAFARWSKVTSDKIIFRYVDSTQTSQLDVFFVNKIDKDKSNSDKSIGLTEGKYNSKTGYITHATIWIADYDQKGKELNKDIVFTTMLHEIGHAIGLEHTSNSKSVMFPNVDRIQEISEDDVSNVGKMYGWKK